MNTNGFKSLLALGLTALSVASCTIEDTQPPALSGPSEMSLSLNLAANPDVLSMDGASQSQVSIEARDSNGQPASNVPLRVEILADGQSVDFGSISARTVVTNGNGRATFVYTAPASAGGEIPTLNLSVTPTGTDASAQLRRLVEIRLVPPGVIAIGPTPRFTFLPTSPAAFTDVRFDGSTSSAGIGATITSYVWDFGDGTSGTGIIATHSYSAGGTYLARLTVTDNNGLSNQSAAQPVTVGAGAVPNADYVFSPSLPTVGETVFFNATISTAGPGHRIVRYEWDFGSGSKKTGASVTKAYDSAGTFNVVLTVTDEVGQVARAAKGVVVVPVAAAKAAFVFSPTDPIAGQTVSFNASASTPSDGKTITKYEWDFGDSGSASGSSAIVTHSYGVAATYVVTLKITDSAGKTALASQTVTVE